MPQHLGDGRHAGWRVLEAVDDDTATSDLACTAGVAATLWQDQNDELGLTDDCEKALGRVE